jgi:hypothetical protein
MDKVLFIHVPRCGGTSITKHHKVGEKARAALRQRVGVVPWLWRSAGLVYYYYRYQLLESVCGLLRLFVRPPALTMTRT